MSTPADGAARRFATDPAHNVVLEASAGTGKTSVLVERYVNLLRAGVAPANILAITFTRQAAAEMRARIVAALRRDAAESAAGRARWNELRDRLGDVAVSTIDAFCLALLREFPLEADLDPDFGMADETEIPGLVDESVRLALDAAARRAARDPALAMLLAGLGPRRSGDALRSLLERRLTAGEALRASLRGARPDPTGEQACRRAAAGIADSLAGLREELAPLVDLEDFDAAEAELLAADLRRTPAMAAAPPPAVRAWLERLRSAFLTRQGTPRKRFARPGADAAARRRYSAAASLLAPRVHAVLQAFDRDVNLVLARAVRTLFELAVAQYEQVLRSRALLDFSGVLQRAVELLRRMDEFARSRFRLESRYHHVLVDEFQDTSRLQWELVSLLVRSWGEGSGLVEEAPLKPTVFVVGDRKQSIYRFRDADVATFREATAAIAALRAGGEVRRSIAHSFRAVPELLGFVNDLFAEIGADVQGSDPFRYEEHDRFPVAGAPAGGDALGLVAAPAGEACAEAVAAEIAALLDGGQVRPKDGGGARRVRPEDVAILFRTRESHREFERALTARSVRTYVYKGLGFADAEEIKDVRALIRFLARPSSELRAAALLRSRIARMSDAGLLALAGGLSAALVDPDPPPAAESLDEAGPVGAGPGARRPARLAGAGRPPPAGRAARPHTARHVLRVRAARPQRRAGAGQPAARPRPGPSHPEPRLRDHGARIRPARAAVRRHVERGRGDGRRGEPDDGARRQGAGVSDRVSRRPSAAARGCRSRRCASCPTSAAGSRWSPSGRTAARRTTRSGAATARRPSGCCTWRRPARVNASTCRRWSGDGTAAFKSRQLRQRPAGHVRGGVRAGGGDAGGRRGDLAGPQRRRAPPAGLRPDLLVALEACVGVETVGPALARWPPPPRGSGLPGWLLRQASHRPRP